MKRVGVREEEKSMWSENEETDRKNRKREPREGVREREEVEIG